MAPTKKYFQSSPQSAFDFLAESPVDSAVIFSPFAPPPLPKASLWRHPRLRPYLDLCEGILRDAFEVRDLFLGYAARGQPPPSWLRQQIDQDLLWVASTEEEQERFSFVTVCGVLDLDPGQVRVVYQSGRSVRFFERPKG